MELLSEDNVCGRTLLSIVGSGSAIITELLRLSDHIPPAFIQPKSVKPTARSKYAAVLFDFSYLKNPEDFDEKIDNSPDLVDLDEEFRENHVAVLERFYQLFESIYRFVSDYQQFLEQLMEGDFVQHSLENLLLDTDGRQLMCEALHLYGTYFILLFVVSSLVRVLLFVCMNFSCIYFPPTKQNWIIFLNNRCHVDSLR